MIPKLYDLSPFKDNAAQQDEILYTLHNELRNLQEGRRPCGTDWKSTEQRKRKSRELWGYSSNGSCTLDDPIGRCESEQRGENSKERRDDTKRRSDRRRCISIHSRCSDKGEQSVIEKLRTENDKLKCQLIQEQQRSVETDEESKTTMNEELRCQLEFLQRETRDTIERYERELNDLRCDNESLRLNECKVRAEIEGKRCELQQIHIRQTRETQHNSQHSKGNVFDEEVRRIRQELQCKGTEMEIQCQESAAKMENMQKMIDDLRQQNDDLKRCCKVNQTRFEVVSRTHEAETKEMQNLIDCLKTQNGDLNGCVQEQRDVERQRKKVQLVETRITRDLGIQHDANCKEMGIMTDLFGSNTGSAPFECKGSLFDKLQCLEQRMMRMEGGSNSDFQRKPQARGCQTIQRDVTSAIHIREVQELLHDAGQTIVDMIQSFHMVQKETAVKVMTMNAIWENTQQLLLEQQLETLDVQNDQSPYCSDSIHSQKPKIEILKSDLSRVHQDFRCLMETKEIETQAQCQHLQDLAQKLKVKEQALAQMRCTLRIKKVKSKVKCKDTERCESASFPARSLKSGHHKNKDEIIQIKGGKKFRFGSRIKSGKKSSRSPKSKSKRRSKVRDEMKQLLMSLDNTLQQRPI